MATVDWTGTKRSEKFWRAHSLSDEQFQNLLRGQNMQCKDCSKPIELHPWLYSACIDHDHKCCPGKASCSKCVRAILCLGCNVRRRYKEIGYRKGDVVRVWIADGLAGKSSKTYSDLVKHR